MSQTDKKPKSHLTIWSSGTLELIPSRFRRILIFVMPIIYVLIFLFGLTAVLFPHTTVARLSGIDYSFVWANLVGAFALISLVGLIFKLRIELYSSIILTVLIATYPLYLIYEGFHDPQHLDFTRLSTIFAGIIYVIMPAWRSIDIVLDIRKAQQRRLYAESLMGEK